MKASTLAIVLILVLCFFDETLSARGKCGERKSPRGQLLGGKPSLKYKWPWVASLTKIPQEIFFCAGNLISPKKVLTAAHCIQPKSSKKKLKKERIKVKLGEIDLTKNGRHSASFVPIEIIIHQDWDPTHDRYDADVAILVSQYSMESLYISPICIPQESLSSNHEITGTITGWGFKSGSAASTETKLREIEVKKVSEGECFRKSWGLGEISSDRTFCITGVAENSNVCIGDSGGGFFVEVVGVWYLHGIVSSAIFSVNSYCPDTKHSILTDIIPFLDWADLENSEGEKTIRVQGNSVKFRDQAIEALGQDVVDVLEKSGIAKLFSCNDPEGLAACWHNDWRRRDARCNNNCKIKRKFSFDYQFGGKCHCCHCN